MEMKSAISQKLHEETLISLLTRAVKIDIDHFIRGMDGAKRARCKKFYICCLVFQLNNPKTL